MKADLATSVLAAIIGVVAAYFIVNLFLPPIEDVTFSTLTATDGFTLTEPDQDIFNFRALNPTVEVYVGGCSEYNEQGECLDDIRSSANEETPTEEQNQNQETNPNEEN